VLALHEKVGPWLDQQVNFLFNLLLILFSFQSWSSAKVVTS